MAVSLVSQHGPNPQSSKPDRSVSLPVPDPRETAATMLGGVGNVSSLTLKRLQKRRATLIDRYERLKPEVQTRLYDRQMDELLDAIEAIEEEIRKMQPPPPPPPVDVWDLDDPAQRKAAIEKWGGRHLNPVPEYEPDLPPDTAAMGAMAPTMMAHMASGEPGRIGRAAPEGPVPDYEPPSPMSDEERRRGKEWIEKIRKDNEDVLNPESSMSSIWDTIMNVVPDVDPQTAIMVAAAVAAMVAAGTGVGGPLAPVILGGGAALASQ